MTSARVHRSPGARAHGDRAPGRHAASPPVLGGGGLGPSSTQSSAPDGERLRLMVVAARLYHVHGVRQRDIAARLGMSQTRVSRLLTQAEQHDIVRTVIAVPDGMHPDLEDRIEAGYGVAEVHVVEPPYSGADLAAVLGLAAARHYSEASLAGGNIGFTSWSRTLREMAFALGVHPRNGASRVVEMLGGLGPPHVQHAATRSTQALARALGAEPVFLRTPGVVTEPTLRAAALQNPHVQRALRLLDDIDVAFVGVGPAEVHSELTAGESFFEEAQLDRARAAGAIAQLNQRFLDARGTAVATPLDDLVVGSTLGQLAAARRRIVVAGGAEKHIAIHAALRGGWVDVLFTDAETARHLVAEIDRVHPLAATEAAG